ncbi:hypothetical protein IW262DRAFT_541950 [Armillaria fumosa]|nr:hypothetical protein IW262DRAFT_541950 [Armillaria fumosa]
MGSVHHARFPQVVPESAASPDNLGSVVYFDATPDILDDKVIRNRKGQRGGVLVTTENATVRSDLRLFILHNNAIIQRSVIPRRRDYQLMIIPCKDWPQARTTSSSHIKYVRLLSASFSHAVTVKSVVHSYTACQCHLGSHGFRKGILPPPLSYILEEVSRKHTESFLDF